MVKIQNSILCLYFKKNNLWQDLLHVFFYCKANYQSFLEKFSKNLGKSVGIGRFRNKWQGNLKLIYRITSNNVRGHYRNFPFFSADIIRGRTLLEVLNFFFMLFSIILFETASHAFKTMSQRISFDGPIGIISTLLHS